MFVHVFTRFFQTPRTKFPNTLPHVTLRFDKALDFRPQYRSLLSIVKAGVDWPVSLLSQIGDLIPNRRPPTPPAVTAFGFQPEVDISPALTVEWRHWRSPGREHARWLTRWAGLACWRGLPCCGRAPDAPRLKELQTCRKRLSPGCSSPSEPDWRWAHRPRCSVRPEEPSRRWSPVRWLA